MENQDNENQIIESDVDESSELSNNISIMEYFGPDWKEYFAKPETIHEIIKEVACQKSLQERRKSNNKIYHEFISISSKTDLGSDRLKMTVMLREIKTGLTEKWIFDIISTAPSWEQILDTLYCPDDDCAGRIIIYCENLIKELSDKNSIERSIDYWMRYSLLWDIYEFSKNIFLIYATAYIECAAEDDIFFCFTSMQPNGSSERRKNIPVRSKFENTIWDMYYSKFKQSAVIEKPLQSKLITETFDEKIKIPFCVMPEWTDKGLFLLLYAVYECPKTLWLIEKKKDELARRYPGCEMKVNMKPGTHYCIDIQLHDAPVADFVKSSTTAKFNYASEIRKQHLDLMKHIKDIFQDYVTESK